MTSSTESSEQKDHLIIHNPDGSVDKIPFPEETGVVLTLGRELDNEVTLADPRSSRHHARLRRVADGQLEIMDIGSANGTIVGATAVDVDVWQSFSPGQVAQIGDTRIMWEQAATSQSTVPMTPITGPRMADVGTPPQPSSGGSSMLIGLIVLLLVGLLGWILVTVLRPARSDIAVTGSDTVVNTPADISQQTTEAVVAATEIPAATPAPAHPSMIIERIEYLPVISGALFDPKHVYMIVKVRVENLGDEPFFVSTDRFRAVTANGDVLEEFGQQFAPSEFSRLGVIDRFEELRLGSGGSVAEELIFFLETEPYQLNLQFQPENLESLQVSLGTIDGGQQLIALIGEPTPAPVAVVDTPTPEPTATTDTASTDTLAVVDTPTPTSSPTPTETPTPENTATVTPVPTPTFTPPPAPAGGSRTIPSESLIGTIAFPDFVGGKYDLYFGDVASGDVNLWRQETSQPTFSNSGARIAFHSWTDSNFGLRGLVTSNVDHSNEKLVATFLEDQLPTWSPDDTHVMFLSRRTGTRQSQLYVAQSDQDRPEPEFLIEGEYPTWGANGTVVFKGWETSGIGLRVSSGDIANHESLTDNDADIASSISPDGTRVVFMSRRDDNWDIYIVNIDGSNLTRLTTDTSDDGLPTWSPDGNAIAFVSNRGGPWAVWAMTPRGTGIRQLFTMQGSPDGHVATEPTSDTTRGWAEERISWTSARLR